MSPLEPRNPARLGSENYSVAEAQDKDMKITMNMREVLNEEMNKSLNEIYENTNRRQK